MMLVRIRERKTNKLLSVTVDVDRAPLLVIGESISEQTWNAYQRDEVALLASSSETQKAVVQNLYSPPSDDDQPWQPPGSEKAGIVHAAGKKFAYTGYGVSTPFSSADEAWAHGLCACSDRVGVDPHEAAFFDRRAWDAMLVPTKRRLQLMYKKIAIVNRAAQLCLANSTPAAAAASSGSPPAAAAPANDKSSSSDDNPYSSGDDGGEDTAPAGVTSEPDPGPTHAGAPQTEVLNTESATAAPSPKDKPGALEAKALIEAVKANFSRDAETLRGFFDLMGLYSRGGISRAGASKMLRQTLGGHPGIFPLLDPFLEPEDKAAPPCEPDAGAHAGREVIVVESSDSDGEVVVIEEGPPTLDGKGNAENTGAPQASGQAPESAHPAPPACPASPAAAPDEPTVPKPDPPRSKDDEGPVVIVGDVPFAFVTHDEPFCGHRLSRKKLELCFRRPAVLVNPKTDSLVVFQNCWSHLSPGEKRKYEDITDAAQEDRRKRHQLMPEAYCRGRTKKGHACMKESRKTRIARSAMSPPAVWWDNYCCEEHARAAGVAPAPELP